MKLIRTEDAVGQVLCHDITQIIPGQFKGARFRKGHIVQPEDIPVLLSIGKENLYVWEKKPGILHEDEAAALLYKAAAGKNIHGTEPREGKIELIADCDGLLKIHREALLAVNRTPQMMIATIHGDLPVKKGAKLAGTRIIPLVIEQEKMDAMQKAAGSEPILNVLPFHQKKFAVITTGSEVFKGRIEDPVYEAMQQTLVSNLRGQLQQQGIPFEQFVQSQGGEQQFGMIMMMQTREMLVQGYALDALFRHEKMTLTDEDIDAACRSMNPQNPDAVKREMQENGRGFALREAAERMKANQWLLDHAIVNVEQPAEQQ